jgi:hypothetical protein
VKTQSLKTHSMNRHPLPTRVRSVLAVCVLAIGLSGCVSAPASIDQGTASAMQQKIASVAAAASSKDFSAATARLAELQKELDQAAAAGKLSSSRVSQIQTAINNLAKDLVAASPTPLPPAPVPAPAPAPGKDGGNGNSKGKGGDNSGGD